MNPSFPTQRDAAILKLFDQAQKNLMKSIQQGVWIESWTPDQKPVSPTTDPHHASNVCPGCGKNLDGIFACRQCEGRGLLDLQLHVLTSSEGRATVEQRHVIESWRWPTPISLRHVGDRIVVTLVGDSRHVHQPPAVRVERMGASHHVRATIELPIVRVHGLPGAPYCDHDYYMPF